MVDKSVPLRSVFSAPPTRDGSAFAFSLLNVLHSDPTSITLPGLCKNQLGEKSWKISE